MQRQIDREIERQRVREKDVKYYIYKYDENTVDRQNIIEREIMRWRDRDIDKQREREREKDVKYYIYKYDKNTVNRQTLWRERL